MITIYKTGAEFLKENIEFIKKHALKACFMKLNAMSIDICDKKRWALRIEEDDKLLLAVNFDPFHLIFIGDDALMPLLVKTMDEHDLYFKSTLSPLDISEAFYKEYEKKHQGSHYNKLSMDIMSCSEVNECDDSDVEKATNDDIDGMVDNLMHFYKEALNEEVGYDEMKAKILATLNDFALIKDNVEIVAMAKKAREDETTACISDVYTRKEYRGKGLARKVVSYITKDILDSGKLAYLFVDKTNPISNHLYKSIGYEYEDPMYEIHYKGLE